MFGTIWNLGFLEAFCTFMPIPTDIGRICAGQPADPKEGEKKKET